MKNESMLRDEFSDSGGMHEEDEVLTPEEFERAREVAERIDLGKPMAIASYGEKLQSMAIDLVTSLASQARQLSKINIAEPCQKAKELMSEFYAELERSQRRRFIVRGSRTKELQQKFEETSKELSFIVMDMVGSQRAIKTIFFLLQELLEKEARFQTNLSVYIQAGKMKLEAITADSTNSQLGRYEQDFSPETLRAECEKFRGRIVDLKLARQISLQRTAQINLLEADIEEMTQVITKNIAEAIPLWIQSMTLRLRMEGAQELGDEDGELKLSKIEVRAMKQEILDLGEKVDEVLARRSRSAKNLQQASLEIDYGDNNPEWKLS